MIRISHEHKAIFCHIPRCGGTSIEEVLEDWKRIDHTPLGRVFFEQYPHVFCGTGDYVYDLDLDYFVFTVVRNPYDRYISGINHAMRQPLPPGYYWYHEHVIATQKATLGRLVPDYYIRLENIDNDFEFIREKFGIEGKLPKLNSTKGNKITDKEVKWVDEHYAEDFDMFRYNQY